MEEFDIYVTLFNQNFIDFNLKLMGGLSLFVLVSGYPTDIVSCL